MAMQIGIDVSIVPYGRGVSNYILHLLDNFRKLSPDNEYRLFFNSPRPCPLPFDSHDFTIKTFKIPWRILDFFWSNLSLPKIEWFIGTVDMFHSPAHSPVYAICPPADKWIVTVHDLFTFKLNYSEKTKQKEWRVLRKIERTAAHVIAVSHSTKNDLLELVPSLEPRVSVIHEGVDEQFKFVANYHSSLAKYNINTPYILYVGSAGPNKNLITLLKSFMEINQMIEHQLVLVGDIKWRYSPLIDLVKEKNLEERVRFTGLVPDEDLASIYSGADVFVCPSIYEGFGLTVLEAMACGTPVIASNISSIPEIAGDSAILFDPYSVDELSHSLLEVLGSDTLAARLKAMGSSTVKKFSWASTAQQTLQLYKDLIS